MYAGFWKRVAAAILDLLILVVPILVVGVTVALITGPLSPTSRAVDAVALLLPWLYFALLESSKRGATVGKRVFGARVVNLEGERISFLRASARFFSKIFSLASLTLGFLLAAVTPRKQGLHDYVASCMVVNASTTAEDVRRAGVAQPLSRRALALLVIATIAIPVGAAAAAIAIPKHQERTVRKKVNEVVQGGQSATTAVADYMFKYQTPPRTLEEAQARPASPHLRDSTITRDGTILLTLAIGDLDGKRIAFVPAQQGPGKIVWTCTTDDIPPRYLPRHCRGK